MHQPAVALPAQRVEATAECFRWRPWRTRQAHRPSRPRSLDRDDFILIEAGASDACARRTPRCEAVRLRAQLPVGYPLATRQLPRSSSSFPAARAIVQQFMRGIRAVAAVLFATCAHSTVNGCGQQREGAQATSSRAQKRIWEGKPFPEYHFVVAIGTKSANGAFTATCSGIALTKDRVLTAGHCVNACGAVELWITDSSDTDVIPKNQPWKVEQAIRHYWYGPATGDPLPGKKLRNDLAILEIPGAEFVAWPIERSELVSAKVSARKLGYGWSHEGNTLFRGERLGGNGKIGATNDSTMDRFSFLGNVRTCQFDSGGGTFTLDATGEPTSLVGITSSMISPTPQPTGDAGVGPPCSSSALDVAVSAYRDWIDQALKGECSCERCSR